MYVIICVLAFLIIFMAIVLKGLVDFMINCSDDVC